MSTNKWIPISRTANRTEFANENQVEDRFIHRTSRTSRKAGQTNQPIYKTSCTLVSNTDYAAEGSNVPMLLPASVSVSFSVASVEEAQTIWNTMKAEVDQIFTNQPSALRGLPLSPDYNIND